MLKPHTTCLGDIKRRIDITALAMWHKILKAKELGLEVFDFEGSVIPPIERYCRGFGGQLTPIFSVHKAWLPIEMAMKVRPH